MAARTLSIAVKRLRDNAELPARLTSGAAGADLSAALDEPQTIQPGRFARIPCGFSIAIPEGFEGQVRPRSGLAARQGVTVLNAPGTIDSDYRGEVSVLLINHGPEAFAVTPGMRIAQLVIAPVITPAWTEAVELPSTDRGSGGFGHTGT